ncbi:MAG: thioesterase [Actinobacteria bacterium]|nr:thioesterase [Actinomycetota bacterium]
MPLEPGLSATIHAVVEDSDTAVSLGSGDVPVLGTPRIVALAEEATVAAVAGHLDDGQTTVGTEVQLEHLAPTCPGAAVEAQATLAKVEARRLSFVVRIHDDRGLVAAGKITRALVDRNRFLEKAGGDRAS